MEFRINLEIYVVERKSYGYSPNIIFKDSKNKEYNSYEDIKTDVLKLAEITKKSCKENQDFEISVCFAKNVNWCVATYYSYFDINKFIFGAKQGYNQQYENWEKVINIFDKHIADRKPEVTRIIFDKNKLSDKKYVLETFNKFAAKNLDKELILKEPISNDWNAEISKIKISKDGTIYINCYWQGDSTDGDKLVKFNNKDISFIVEEQTLRKNLNHKINFDLDEIIEAFKNVLIENCIEK